jgi:hypothetical protein
MPQAGVEPGFATKLSIHRQKRTAHLRFSGHDHAVTERPGAYAWKLIEE